MEWEQEQNLVTSKTIKIKNEVIAVLNSNDFLKQYKIVVKKDQRKNVFNVLIQIYLENTYGSEKSLGKVIKYSVPFYDTNFWQKIHNLQIREQIKVQLQKLSSETDQTNQVTVVQKEELDENDNLQIKISENDVQL